MDWKALLENIGNWITTEGLKVVISIILLYIACKIVDFIAKKIDKKLESRHMDETLRKVLVPTVRKVIKVLLFVCVIGYLGFETSSISAAILSVGATIGLALQGSLSNFAGGILIITLRPYKIGDYIVVDGVEGTVTEVALFYTYLATPDNKVIIIPNSKASSSNVVNVSKNPTRREDMKFTISYNQDFEKAKEVIMEVINKCDCILADPAPFVNVAEHGDSAIVILARWWTKSEDYWTAHWYMLEEVKKAFDANNIEIPYPQMDVHMKNN